jgi:hypothetical protein
LVEFSMHLIVQLHGRTYSNTHIPTYSTTPKPVRTYLT